MTGGAKSGAYSGNETCLEEALREQKKEGKRNMHSNSCLYNLSSLIIVHNIYIIYQADSGLLWL